MIPTRSAIDPEAMMNGERSAAGARGRSAARGSGGLKAFAGGLVLLFALLEPPDPGLAQQPNLPTRRGAITKLNGGKLRTPPSLAARSEAPAAIKTTGTGVVLIGDYLDADRVEEACRAQAAPAPPTPVTPVPPSDPCALPGGLDHVQDGVALRNTGSGTVLVVGAEPGSVAVAAELVWALVIEPDDVVPTTASINGTPLLGTEIGRVEAPCWGSPNNGWELLALRATVDVSLLNPGINGEYTIADVPSFTVDGSSPFDGLFEPPMPEGATLIVVYAHEQIPRDAGLYRFDMVGLHRGASAYRFALDPPLPEPLAGVKLTEIAADGQTHDGYSFVYPLRTSIGHSELELAGLGLPPRALTVIRSQSGSELEQHAPWQGRDGSEEQQLWDTQTLEFDNLSTGPPILEPGATSFDLCYDTPGLVPCPAPGVAPLELPSGGLLHDCIVPLRLLLGVSPI